MIQLASTSFNGSDWGVLGVLVLFLLFGLIFGATKIGAKIVLYVVSAFLSIFVANIVLPYLTPLDWYQNVISVLGNPTLVNWIATIIVGIVAFGLIFGLLSLIVNPLIKALEKAKVLTRVLGLFLGAADWAILVIAVSFLLVALTGWLGTNSPNWLTTANDYVASSTIAGKLVELYEKVLPALGITA
ncbi:MAG: CvpA family protein [Bacilli bacterium]|jgi:uncharacterized membrane protein required for colicin V production|nr:CvpA family protein [Bacilli bacterium]